MVPTIDCCRSVCGRARHWPHEIQGRPMSANDQPDFRIFDAGNVVLQSGLTYRGACLAYKTYGELNTERNNAIVFCTPFGAQHTDIEFMIAPGLALDPTKHFIIIP